MEQAVLARCAYISPFLNGLKAGMGPSDHGPDPNFDVCVNSERYYEQHSYPTRAKACGAVNFEQILQLAGVHAFTGPAGEARGQGYPTLPIQGRIDQGAQQWAQRWRHR
ncbi:MAG: hypothetical protein Q9171_004429 [Xanthocarpia ochracea]